MSAKFHVYTQPCPWFQADIALATELLPQTQALVFFADDVPGYDNRFSDTAEDIEAGQHARVNFYMEQFKGLSQNCPNRQNMSEFDMHFRGGMIANHAFFPSEWPTSARTIDRPADAALIMLPPRHIDTALLTTEFLALPPKLCATLDDVLPHRAIFWHELMHLITRATKGITLTRASDEKQADAFSTHVCSIFNQQATARYWMNLRLVQNFLSPISPSSANYWNAPQHFNPDMTPQEAYFALCDLKEKVAESLSPCPPHTSPQQHAQHLFGPSSPIPAQDRLKALVQEYESLNFQVPASTVLARQIREATQLIAPRILTL